MLQREGQRGQSFTAPCRDVEAEHAGGLRSRITASVQNGGALPIDLTQPTAKGGVEVGTQYRGERRGIGQPLARMRLASVVEPFCGEKISINEAGENHPGEKADTKPGQFLATPLQQSADLGFDPGGSGSPMRPFQRSWPRGI